MFDTHLSKKEEEILEQVKKDFFLDAAVDIRIRMEGMRVEETVVLGCQAGPSIALSNLFHEMAHLVEIDSKRATKPNWGLSLRHVKVFGRECAEPITMKATEREIRVFAYQSQLHKLYGLSESIEDGISSLRFMPDWCYVPRICEKLYQGKDWLSDGDKRRIQFCIDKVNALAVLPQYSLDSFKQEWYKKQDVIRNTI